MTSTVECEVYSRVRDFVDGLFLTTLICYALENRNLTDPEQVERAIKLGEYIKNGA